MFKIIALAALGYIIWRIEKMGSELNRVQTEVTENTTVVESAVTLLGSLSEKIRELSTDPAALNALADQLDANSNKLAAAVASNTPAAESEEIPDEDLEPIPEEPTDESGQGGGSGGAGEDTVTSQPQPE